MTASNGFLTRDSFLAFTKRRFKEVNLPDGQHCRIRSISEAEYAEVDSRNIDFRKGGLSVAGIRGSNVRLIIACVCDGDGQPIFSDSDASQLSQVDAAVIEPLVREIREHCGLRQDSDDILKNSVATGGAGSPTSSAERSPNDSTLATS